MRSQYTVCHKNFTKSGKGESDASLLFEDGSDIMEYMNCVFASSPSLDVIVREISTGARGETEIEEESFADHTDKL